jgi:hypothetical protein
VESDSLQPSFVSGSLSASSFFLSGPSSTSVGRRQKSRHAARVIHLQSSSCQGSTVFLRRPTHLQLLLPQSQEAEVLKRKFNLWYLKFMGRRHGGNLLVSYCSGSGWGWSSITVRRQLRLKHFGSTPFGGTTKIWTQNGDRNNGDIIIMATFWYKLTKNLYTDTDLLSRLNSQLLCRRQIRIYG